MSSLLEPDGQVDLARGQYLFRRSDPAKRLFLVVKGRVQLSRVAKSGRELIVARAGEGSWVAEAALTSNHYHCDCRAERKSTVAVFERARVLSEFEQRPALALSYVGELSAQVRRLRALLEVRQEPNAGARILAYVDIMSVFEEADTVRLPSTRALAGELGLAEETVYRALAKLTDSAALEVDRTGEGVRLRRKV